jgi:hypothetical protein
MVLKKTSSTRLKTNLNNQTTIHARHNKTPARARMKNKHENFSTALYDCSHIINS